MVFKIIFSIFSCISKMIFRSTFPEPQPDSASYAWTIWWCLMKYKLKIDKHECSGADRRGGPGWQRFHQFQRVHLVDDKVSMKSPTWLTTTYIYIYLVRQITVDSDKIYMGHQELEGEWVKWSFFELCGKLKLPLLELFIYLFFTFARLCKQYIYLYMNLLFYLHRDTFADFCLHFYTFAYYYPFHKLSYFCILISFLCCVA